MLYKSKEREGTRERLLFYLFLFVNGAFPPFSYNLIIPLCFRNAAAALVPIKHGELN